MKAKRQVIITRGKDIEFKVTDAKLKKITKGEFKGQQYVELQLQDTDFFADKGDDHKELIFISQDRVPQWEAAIENIESIPSIFGCDITVENLPPYRSKDRKTGEWRETVKTTMRVFSRVKAGMPTIDPEAKCMRILTTMKDDFSLLPEDEDTDE